MKRRTGEERPYWGFGPFKSRSATSLTKQPVQRGQDLDTACIRESDLFGLSFSIPDRSEGMSAFLADRQPRS